MKNCEQLMQRVTTLKMRGSLCPYEFAIMCHVVGSWLGGMPARPRDLDPLLKVGSRQRRTYVARLRGRKLLTIRQVGNVLQLLPRLDVLPEAQPDESQQVVVEESKPAAPKEPYLPIQIPDAWAKSLSPEQQARSQAVRQSQHKTVTQLLTRHRPSDLKPDILKKVQGAKWPLSYLAKLCTEAGYLKRHVRAESQSSNKPAPVSARPDTPPAQPTLFANTPLAPPDPPLERGPVLSDEELSCQFASINAMLDSRLSQKPTPRTTSKPRSRPLDTSFSNLVEFPGWLTS